MNKNFINKTKTLYLKTFKTYNTNDIDLLTSQFNNHGSIRKIKVCYPEIISDTFQFTLVSA